MPSGKGADEPESVQGAGAPIRYQPMLATSAKESPRGGRWRFELKWDGYRALARVGAGGAAIWSRRGNDLSKRAPHILPALVDLLSGRSAVTDGELVAFDEQGKPSFGHLQAGDGNIGYIVFDLLELDGRPIYKQLLRARRAQLDELFIAGRDQSTTIASSTLFEDGQELLAACRRLGLEGVMAKDSESIYTPGTRSPSWLKITCRPADTFVIVGYRPGQRGRQRSLGALLLATRDSPGQPLRYAGRVGSGFSDVELNELGQRLRALKLADPAAAPAIEAMPSGRAAEGAVLVQPSLVCEVAFHEWTRAGELRQPSWQGLHERADPNSVVRKAITESEAD